MKNTMKIVSVIVFSLFAFSSYSQFGVRGGVGIFSMSFGDNDNNISSEFYNAGLGLSVGGAYEIDFSDNVSLEPALLFSQKAFSTDLGELIKVKLLFIEMPINMKVYALDLGDVGRLYGLGGVDLDFMISGKANGRKVNIGTKNNDIYKPFNVALNFGAGVQFFESLNVDLSGSFGVVNLLNVQTNGLASRTNIVKLTVTYQFGE